MRGAPPPMNGDTSALLTWLFIALLVYAGLQFRPAKRGMWIKRWKRWWEPFLLAIGAMAKMAWQGFVQDPALRLWRWRSAVRESHASLDQAIDKMLGRE